MKKPQSDFDTPRFAVGDRLCGFLAYGNGRRGGVKSVWLESERSDTPYRVALAAEVLRDYDPGDRVLVEVTATGDSRGKGGSTPRGRVVSMIAASDDPDRAAKGLMHAYGISGDWKAAVKAEAKALSHMGVQPQDTHRDLRDTALVTIDGQSARDFDDAVYCERKAGGWRLLVAIADVSSYVKPGGAIDAEAKRRSTSTYLPRHVVPMLPKVLSNDLCSLVPHQDRLVLAVDMQISRQGEIESFTFFEAIMRSKARLTYTRVGQLVEQGTTKDLDRSVVTSLKCLHECFLARLAAREKRGALEFETSEAEFIFKKGAVAQVRPSTRNAAHQMIEESMIAANICAATLLEEAGLGCLFRVHPPPSGAKCDALLETLNLLGANLREIDFEHFASLIRRLATRVPPEFLSAIVLRAMQQAVYSPDNQGHFGLALERYAHFTSPIRRYPDLTVHRAIKAKLGIAREAEFRRAKLEALGAHCSRGEREAEACERDVRAWYLADYADRHIGDAFQGTITGVTSFGLFVLLDDLMVEGLLHISALGRDWFEFNASAHKLTGEASDEQFGLGGRIDVVIASVDVDRRKVELVRATPSGKAGGTRSRRRRRAR